MSSRYLKEVIFKHKIQVMYTQTNARTTHRIGRSVCLYYSHLKFSEFSRRKNLFFENFSQTRTAFVIFRFFFLSITPSAFINFSVNIFLLSTGFHKIILCISQKDFHGENFSHHITIVVDDDHDHDES